MSLKASFRRQKRRPKMILQHLRPSTSTPLSQTSWPHTVSFAFLLTFFPSSWQSPNLRNLSFSYSLCTVHRSLAKRHRSLFTAHCSLLFRRVLNGKRLRSGDRMGSSYGSGLLELTCTITRWGKSFIIFLLEPVNHSIQPDGKT
jgi:hypothetical protein